MLFIHETHTEEQLHRCLCLVLNLGRCLSVFTSVKWSYICQRSTVSPILHHRRPHSRHYSRTCFFMVEPQAGRVVDTIKHHSPESRGTLTTPPLCPPPLLSCKQKTTPMWRLSFCGFATPSELRSTSRQGVSVLSLGQASPFPSAEPPMLLVPDTKEKVTQRPWLFRNCKPRDLSLSPCSALASHLTSGRLPLVGLPLPFSILRVATRIKWVLALWLTQASSLQQILSRRLL